jgi:hypothetical protein
MKSALDRFEATLINASRQLSSGHALAPAPARVPRDAPRQPSAPASPGSRSRPRGGLRILGLAAGSPRAARDPSRPRTQRCCEAPRPQWRWRSARAWSGSTPPVEVTDHRTLHTSPGERRSTGTLIEGFGGNMVSETPSGQARRTRSAWARRATRAGCRSLYSTESTNSVTPRRVHASAHGPNIANGPRPETYLYTPPPPPAQPPVAHISAIPATAIVIIAQQRSGLVYGTLVVRQNAPTGHAADRSGHPPRHVHPAMPPASTAN